MQIVIDISKDTFEKIREFDGKFDVLLDRGDLYEAIKNGIALPERHGRLIDEDYILRHAKSIRTVAEVSDAPEVVAAT